MRQFRAVLCRIRLFPTLISKIKWFASELPLNENVQRSRVKPDQVDRIRGDYYEIIKRRPWFRNEENSENQDSIIQVIRNVEIFQNLIDQKFFWGVPYPQTGPILKASMWKDYVFG